MVSAAQGEVVDAEYSRCRMVGIGQRADLPQQRHPADRGRQMPCHPGTRPTTQSQRDGTQQALQNRGAPGVPSCQLRHLLGESPSPTVGVDAEQPPHPQPDHHFPPGDRGVGQSASVATVDSAGQHATPGARGWFVTRPCFDSHPNPCRVHTLDPQPVQMREQDRHRSKIRTPAT